MDRINPRHLLRDAIRQLADARCPECGRPFDEWHHGLGDCSRMTMLNCNWCHARADALRRYAGWQRQEQQLRDTPGMREYLRRVHADQLRRAREHASHE